MASGPPVNQPLRLLPAGDVSLTGGAMWVGLAAASKTNADGLTARWPPDGPKPHPAGRRLLFTGAQGPIDGVARWHPLTEGVEPGWPPVPRTRLEVIPLTDQRIGPRGSAPGDGLDGQTGVAAPLGGRGHPPRSRTFARRIVPGIAILMVGFVLAPIPLFLWLRFADVPATSFQIQDVVGVSDSGNRPDTTFVQPMDIEDVSRAMIAVTVANEDGRLGERSLGVNWDEQWERRDNPTRFGSSIPQQYVKNLLLLRNQSPPRKLLEAAWAELFAVIVPPRRQLELYLNSAEFGPGIWGICEASWRLAGKHPSALTVPEAVWLLQQLPDPKNRTYAVRDDAPITRSRLAALGGTAAVAERFGIADLAEEQTDPSCVTAAQAPLRLTPPLTAFTAILVALLASLVALTVGVAAWTLGWNPRRTHPRPSRPPAPRADGEQREPPAASAPILT